MTNDLQLRREQLNDAKRVDLVDTAKRLKIRNCTKQRKSELINGILDAEIKNTRSAERLERVFDLIRKNPDDYFICEKEYVKKLTSRFESLTSEIRLHSKILDYLTK